MLATLATVLLLGFCPSSDDTLVPTVTLSPSGEWALEVHPLFGQRGAGRFRIYHHGLAVWQAERDFTLQDVAVADDGSFVGWTEPKPFTGGCAMGQGLISNRTYNLVAHTGAGWLEILTRKSVSYPALELSIQGGDPIEFSLETSEGVDHFSRHRRTSSFEVIAMAPTLEEVLERLRLIAPQPRGAGPGAVDLPLLAETSLGDVGWRSAFAVGPGGQLSAASMRSGLVRLWDVPAGTPCHGVQLGEWAGMWVPILDAQSGPGLSIRERDRHWMIKENELRTLVSPTRVRVGLSPRTFEVVTADGGRVLPSATSEHLLIYGPQGELRRRVAPPFEGPFFQFRAMADRVLMRHGDEELWLLDMQGQVVARKLSVRPGASYHLALEGTELWVIGSDLPHEERPEMTPIYLRRYVLPARPR